jgi:protein-S-isoprenylcysteine O-methyltransferase Ste14
MQTQFLASPARIVANAVVVIGYGVLTYACFLKYHATGELNFLGLLIINSIFVAMYIARRDATSISRSPGLWLLAFAGTCLPLALRPTSPSSWAGMGNILQAAALISVCAALLSLRRSFGIVPANRGVRTQGLYNVVRHPLYASELFWMLGFAIVNPSAWNIGLWILDCALQFGRACAEERFLNTDPVYAQYQARVKYRLVPLVI